MTYALESWLADMQLKAGRLGVMKAMESLEDPRYYANIESTEQQKSEKITNTDATSNLLDRYKQ